jgi:streptomycin 6-kinase
MPEWTEPGGEAARLDAAAKRWNVRVENVVQTPSSLIAFGICRDREVVLKVIRQPGDEWYGGHAAAAFLGRGVVTVLEHAPGEMLLERLRPGTALTELTLSGRDEEAVRTAAGVLREMKQLVVAGVGAPAAETWGHAFERYLSSDDRRIAANLLEEARTRYAALCETQGVLRLCHGDFQHNNILYDARRGWTAIDPKGVTAELEFEIGPLLRNPHGVPVLYSSPIAIRQRLDVLADNLQIDTGRVLQWAFCQAVLSMIWTIEDDGVLAVDDPARLLATTIATMLE